jgi:hypothetical protein
LREEGDSGGVTTLAILFFVDTFTECAKEGECNKHDSSEEFQIFERYHTFIEKHEVSLHQVGRRSLPLPASF